MALKEVIEAWKGRSLPDLLREMYVDQNLSIRDIAKELCISVGVVHKYLCEYGIAKKNDLFKI